MYLKVIWSICLLAFICQIILYDFKIINPFIEAPDQQFRLFLLNWHIIIYYNLNQRKINYYKLLIIANNLELFKQKIIKLRFLINYK